MSDQFPDGPPTPPPGDDGVNLTPSSGSTPPPPPPPPPAAPGPPPPPPAAPGSSVDVGAAFSWAIAKFQQHIGIWVGLAAVVFALRAIQSILGNVISNAASSSCAPATVIGNGGVTSVTACETGIFAGIGVSLVLGIIFGALAWLASVGVYRAALKRSEGAVPEFSMLTTGENLGPYIVVAIVYGILSAVGLVLCIIPGLIVIFLFQFSPLFALDKGQGVGDAFGNLTLSPRPFAALFTVHIYRQLNGEAIAAD